MSHFDRRSVLKASLGGAALLAGPGIVPVRAAEWTNTPEPNASIRVLRWKQFIQAEFDKFAEQTKKFSEKTGIKVKLEAESWEDIRPKAAVAANVGAGPDLIIGTLDDPFKFPEKLIDVTDVADYLGKQYGGWYPVAERYGKKGKNWIAIPQGATGGCLNYRISHMKAAGFEEFPKDTDGFLKLCQALKKNNTPAGFALGHATGDANAWLHWILWGHGAYTVDKDDKVIINSPETLKALEYAKAVSETFIPGCASWNDGSNNKAFLSGELYCTANGISIYVAEKIDPKMKDLADDTYHALWPVGPVGHPTELQLAVPILAFNFTKYPNAAKAFIAFMLEKDQFEKWLSGAQGYLTQTLNAYDSAPVWTADPKNAVFKQASKRALPASGLGTPGEKAATAIADFLVVDMFANYCTGAKDAKSAVAETERQLKRIYR